MRQFSVMLKPASGSCNMRCTYCFYADVMRRRSVKDYGMMSLETAHGIIDQVCSALKPGDEITFAFQGGEPTLAGLNFYRDFCQYQMEHYPEITRRYALQTNGLVIDAQWCIFLKEHHFLVGLSLDSSGANHDENRKGADGGGTYKAVIAAKRLLEQYQVDYNVLTVLTNGLARHPAKAWQTLLRDRIQYVQFVPCLDELEHGAPSAYALTPERFYRFYCGLFPLWIAELKKGNYVSVKLFDDLFHYYTSGLPTACGINGRCGVQFVAEGDGSVFPCDFYVLDEYRMGSLATQSPEELMAAGQPFLAAGRGYENEEPCASCYYRSTCAGGCKRMRESMYISDGVCWYAKLLDEILAPLLQLQGGQ